MHRILSLGAGVQSTTLYLLGMEGKVEFDCAIFSDVHRQCVPLPMVDLTEKNTLDLFSAQECMGMCGV